MDYLENVLGCKTKYMDSNFAGQLPYFIMDLYDVKEVALDGIEIIGLFPRGELAQITSIKKHIATIQSKKNVPIVLMLKKLSKMRREYLIEARIPFIVDMQQIYLPFLGMALQERFSQERSVVNALLPSAQLLFLYYLYGRKESIYTKDVIKVLNFSDMTISRAVKQLVDTGRFATHKDGVKIVLTGSCNGRELFEEMRPYLTSPVRKKVYVDKGNLPAEKLYAGISALAEMSMLNEPRVKTYGIYEKVCDFEGSEVLLDQEKQIEVELWKYNPKILGVRGCVDPLSLVLSLQDNEDERVVEATEEVLRNVWRI